jgi:murein DD-endopeptidase MepM/ murein hydrolase activator NlpD
MSLSKLFEQNSRKVILKKSMEYFVIILRKILCIFAFIPTVTKLKFNIQKLKERLFCKYRMVLINEDTFEEKGSFKLRGITVFILGGLLTIFLIVSTILLIAFTSLREYIPGYTSIKLKKEVSDLMFKVDSLENVLELNSRYLNNIQEVLIGDVSAFAFNKDSVFDEIEYGKDMASVNNSGSDSLFRLEVESEDKYSFFEEAKKDIGVVFFAPVTGTITAEYNINEKHYAVDVVVKTGTPVKAISDGTVIFAEWTAATGHVIIVEHAKEYISIYKHNGSLHKQQGDLVKSGEVIASSGSSGELSTGPHLHFELWSDGYPVNPVNFIDFE